MAHPWHLQPGICWLLSQSTDPDSIEPSTEAAVLHCDALLYVRVRGVFHGFLARVVGDTGQLLLARSRAKRDQFRGDVHAAAAALFAELYLSADVHSAGYERWRHFTEYSLQHKGQD